MASSILNDPVIAGSTGCRFLRRIIIFVRVWVVGGSWLVVVPPCPLEFGVQPGPVTPLLPRF